VGGSGLIVVVIVAAWVLFLVPQWLHRRADAASRLADRVPADAAPTDHDAADPSSPTQDDIAPTRRRRFGRRLLVRTATAEPTAGPFWAGRRLRVPVGRRSTGARSEPPHRSAAARRRRILALLAGATLVTAAVVAVGALVGLSVPAWLVAVPGALMVGYLLLLAIVRPGAPQPHLGAAQVDDADDRAERRPEAGVAVGTAGAGTPPSPAETHPALRQDGGSADGEATWTPVPVPPPTYVTAPRAPRVIRHIDLSNPGSWTAATASAAASVPGETGPDAVESPAAEAVAGYEHRRAVGD